MAKKKATMTLKDFHGGSIPSDLPLPSAPGVTARPSNHSGFDRQTSWGNPMGRQDHRLRPGSAGAVRTYDDKTPFLTHNVQIGRNFDEDERKPLDGVSVPRRTVSDDNIRGGVPIRQEPKLDYPLARNVQSRPSTTPVSHFPTESTNVGLNSYNVISGISYSKSEVRAVRPNSPNVSVENVGGSSPNAWGLRKEALGASKPVAASWSAPDAATKLAHASALEKVSSGRWHSNQHKQIDVEVIRHPEPEAKGNIYNNFSYNSMEVRDIHDTSFEKSRSSVHPSMKERSPSRFTDGDQVQSQFQVPSESSERPKLKFLPRSKPVENEPLIAYKQPSEPGLVDISMDTYGNANSAGHGLAGAEGVHQAIERPKLNLRPRSQPLEQLEKSIEKERNTLFGGARPRELVLKERGVDDVAVSHDVIQSPNRMKKEIPKMDNLPVHTTVISRQNGKVKPLDHHSNAKNAEKSDAQRKSNWRNENRKSSKDLEKQPERAPSPETWRKPVEPEPPSGPRFGKATSAVELAQAFSKSVSDPKVTPNRFPGQRVVPGQTQIPFSRLTTQPTRAHVNGY